MNNIFCNLETDDIGITLTLLLLDEEGTSRVL